MIERRELLAAGIAALTPLPRLLAAPPVAPMGAVTPEMFGAKGDGRTDDSAALAALADHVSRTGGGTVSFARKTYLVARRGDDPASWRVPARLLEFVGCTRPLTILGNGAKIRCADSQRYGMFDAEGQVPRPDAKPGTRLVTATPYKQMILIERCSGSVTVVDLELDGRVGSYVIGGRAGDKGWQIPGTGLKLHANAGPEDVRNVNAHHHPHDGFYVDGLDEDSVSIRRLRGLIADGNGRQGMSIVGGRGYELEDCAFTRTGRVALRSAPGAGVDIEAERGKRIRKLRFTRCRFVDNAGCGLLAQAGDSEDVEFDSCTFIGTDNWSLWSAKPLYRYRRCLMVGSIVNVHGDPDPNRAVQFFDCTFSDDPKLSPTGKLDFRKDHVADLPHSLNVLFERCTFRLSHDGVLPWSQGPIYSNCVMSQRSPKVAHTRGTFRGMNWITGPVRIDKSGVEGTLILNGKRVVQRPGANIPAPRA